MKILSTMKKVVLSVCAIVCGGCCFGAVATQVDLLPNEYVEVKADTATSVSMDWRGTYTNSTTIDYCYIGFAGFTTQDDYNGNASSDYVFQNVLINGVSLYEINNTTDTTGWAWDVFPSTADAKR